MFIGRNIRTRIDLIKPHHTLGVNSKAHKHNLALRTLSPNDQVIVGRYGSKQKWQHGGIVERISCKMYKVLINGKIEDRHKNQIKTAKRLKTLIPKMTLEKHYSINLTYSEQYSKETVTYKKRKPVIRYGFEDK